MPSASAISAVLSRSTYRIARTSRSCGDRVARASLTCSQRSWRTRRLLGLVSWADQLADEIDGRFVGEFGQPALAGDAAALCEQVAAVRVADVLAGDQPQPAEERQRLVPQIIVHPPGRVGQGFLDDIRRIEPRGQPAIEPRRDHAAEIVAITLQQLAPGVVVALAGQARSNRVWLVLRFGHRVVSSSI